MKNLVTFAAIAATAITFTACSSSSSPEDNFCFDTEIGEVHVNSLDELIHPYNSYAQQAINISADYTADHKSHAVFFFNDEADTAFVKVCGDWYSKDVERIAKWGK